MNALSGEGREGRGVQGLIEERGGTGGLVLLALEPGEPQREERGGGTKEDRSQEGRQAGRRGEDKGEGF